ncbi:Uncharacterised protein [Mycobacteroides abscessus subsp. abscessus]|nr:Uncharacterised protein [Mycobacteroides abscessus subsp. abscessus]
MSQSDDLSHKQVTVRVQQPPRIGPLSCELNERNNSPSEIAANTGNKRP